MSEEEQNNFDDVQKELSFYKSQTKVLREKNRDLRNALLLAESKSGTAVPQETTQEAVSDIRKIIADSKKQITEKLSQFKETIHDSNDATASTSGAPAPEISQSTPSIDESSSASATVDSAEAETYKRQVEYLKEEIDRLEVFLEQSEMVNNRLRDLLTKHSIDVSEISKAINEASKSSVSEKEIKQPVVATESEEKIEPVKPIAEPTPPVESKPVVEQKEESVEKKLDPALIKLFDAFREKLIRNPTAEEIKLEILNFREQLMEMIPHSRVFYEMQVEYRKWNKNTSSINALRDALKEWEKTIALTL